MDKAAVLKLARELIGQLSHAFVLATVTPDGRPGVRYMGALVFEEPFTLYMETYLKSHKVDEIKANPNVELLLASADFSKILSIRGLAGMETSAEKKRAVYAKVPASGRYFSGPDDPNFAVIRVQAKALDLFDHKDQPSPYRVEI